MVLTPPELLLLAATALGLGLLHGLGPDHLAAITTFISRSQLSGQRGLGREQGRGQGRAALAAVAAATTEGLDGEGSRPESDSASTLTAARLGLSFGLGHMATLALFGGLALAAGWAIPEGFERGAEIFGGGLLLVLGLWLLAEALGGRYHLHLHAHPHGGEAASAGDRGRRWGSGSVHLHWHGHPSGAKKGEEHLGHAPKHHHGHTHPRWADWLEVAAGVVARAFNRGASAFKAIHIRLERGERAGKRGVSAYRALRGRLERGERAGREGSEGSEGKGRDRSSGGGGERTSLVMGGLFALSGLRSLLLMVPVVAAGTTAGAALVILLFGAGIVASMSTYGILAARVYSRVGSTEQLARRAALLTALVCLGLGAAWMGLAFWT